jgi:glycosyltransferase involved in cell wall biosynthesis
MHIGLVSFADIESGFDMANILIEAGHQVTLYLSYTKIVPLIGETDTPEELLYQARILPRECKIRVYYFPRVRDPRSFNLVKQIRADMDADDIDVAHIMIGPLEIWLSILTLLLHKPVVTTIIIPRPNIGEQAPAWIEIGINRLATYSSELIIANGANLVKDVYDIYKVKSGRVINVPLAPRVTVRRWANEKYHEEPGSILFFGRALPHKGLEYLVKAEPIISQQVPQARFLIAVHGNTEHWKELFRSIRNNPKYEVYEGFAPGELMAAYYERASLVALPYLSASTSGVLLDAYSFGKPVVATTVGSFPEYVDDGKTGLLIPPADVEQLAEAIIKILKNDNLRRQMGENAIKRVEEEKRKIAAQMETIYRQAIELHQKR